jgi:hypothetical protein
MPVKQMNKRKTDHTTSEKNNKINIKKLNEITVEYRRKWAQHLE